MAHSIYLLVLCGLILSSNSFGHPLAGLWACDTDASSPNGHCTTQFTVKQTLQSLEFGERNYQCDSGISVKMPALKLDIGSYDAELHSFPLRLEGDQVGDLDESRGVGTIYSKKYPGGYALIFWGGQPGEVFEWAEELPGFQKHGLDMGCLVSPNL